MTAMSGTSDPANALAGLIQQQVPFEPDPFAALGRQLGCSGEEVRARMHQWSEDGVLREVSAVLEGSALGYDSALVGAYVPPERMEDVAEIVGRHPTVTHNYEREGAPLNLWFTIAVPAEMGVPLTMAILATQTDVRDMFAFRRTHTFKIGVRFDLESRENVTQGGPVAPPPEPLYPGEREKRLLRALQDPLPLCDRPYAALAERWEVDETELLSFAREHLGGVIRRYVGTFRHRRLGVRGNAMVVWNVPDADLQRTGTWLAQQPAVSHCYAREAVPQFPYRLYSMLHGPHREHCTETAHRLAAQLEITDYRVLFSTREFKKCRLRYFLPELERWWRDHAPAGA